MTEQFTPLRRRMIEDRSLHNTLPATQRVYVNAAKTFIAFLGRPPAKLISEDVRTYQLHLVSRGLKPTIINPILCALRFFYGTTLGLSGGAEHTQAGSVIARKRSIMALTCSGTSSWQKCPDPTVLPYRICGASACKRAMSARGCASLAAM